MRAALPLISQFSVVSSGYFSPRWSCKFNVYILGVLTHSHFEIRVLTRSQQNWNNERCFTSRQLLVNTRLVGAIGEAHEGFVGGESFGTAVTCGFVSSPALEELLISRGKSLCTGCKNIPFCVCNLARRAIPSPYLGIVEPL